MQKNHTFIQYDTVTEETSPSTSEVKSKSEHRYVNGFIKEFNIEGLQESDMEAGKVDQKENGPDQKGNRLLLVFFLVFLYFLAFF